MDTKLLTPTPILSIRARLGEGPCWHPTAQRLYCVDIYNHRVHEFDPKTSAHRVFEVGDVVGCLAPAGAHRLIMAQRHHLAFLDTQTGEVTQILTVEPELNQDDKRFNDGKCDAQGRFWFGSLHPTESTGCLYRYDPDGSLHTVETGLLIPNGPAWSPDGKTFYLPQSAQQLIYAYDFDGDRGTLHNRRILVDLTAESFYPDGLTVDRDGCLWGAMWDGWCIIQFDPKGREIRRIPMPVPCPTCCTFGGEDLTTLYITSASVGLSQAQIEQAFYSGDLFSLPTDTAGLPTASFGTGMD